MLFQKYLGKTVFPDEPFFRELQIKCLSKCPYFKKPPLPLKIPSYALVIDFPVAEDLLKSLIDQVTFLKVNARFS